MINLPQLRSRLAGQLAQPAAQLLARRGVKPNAVTGASLLVAIASAAIIAWGYPLWGGLGVLVAGFLDMVDGALARFAQQPSRLGAFLDSTADRLAEAGLLAGILILLLKQGSTQGVLLVYATMVGAVLVSYTRARAEGLGLDCQVGLFTRAERITMLAIGLLINQIVIILWIVALLSYLTLGQRLLHVWQQTRTSHVGD
ncbi:MAG TPA: CDP-alcohol phosphatidyltransferase family protein [Dehalococcoidia bacterium]|nr:CDP-alcohol phosphatidyltransferase family protein [Dehalococcoidia bacterium]